MWVKPAVALWMRLDLSRALFVSILCVSAAGCNSLDCESLAMLGEPTVEVGTGEDEFTPLGPGDVLTAVNGAQGGQHVWGAVRTHNLHPGSGSVEDPETTFEIADADGVIATSGRVTMGLHSLGDGDAEQSGYFVFPQVDYNSTPWLYPPDYDPAATGYEGSYDASLHAQMELETRTFVLSAIVEDGCGRSARGEAMVRLQGVGQSYGY